MFWRPFCVICLTISSRPRNGPLSGCAVGGVWVERGGGDGCRFRNSSRKSCASTTGLEEGVLRGKEKS